MAHPHLTCPRFHDINTLIQPPRPLDQEQQPAHHDLMYSLPTHNWLVPFPPFLLDRNPGTEQPVNPPVRCDLPSPEEIAHDAGDVEMREPTARDLKSRDLVEEERYRCFVRGRFFILVACGDGLSGLSVGEEACLEGGHELDQEDLGRRLG